MINNNIGNKSEPDSKKQQNSTKKPNEVNGVHFSSHVKIYDPNNKQEFVNKRADD